VRVLPLDDHVAEAITPAAVEARVSDDLRLVMTLIGQADTLAQLRSFRCLRLTRLTRPGPCDFHCGTTETGVVLRPVDDNGNQIAVDHMAAGLSGVRSVAIVAVDLTLKEATTYDPALRANK
jgi:hypothetical protein